jgi:hypothetical protein
MFSSNKKEEKLFQEQLNMVISSTFGKNKKGSKKNINVKSILRDLDVSEDDIQYQSDFDSYLEEQNNIIDEASNLYGGEPENSLAIVSSMIKRDKRLKDDDISNDNLTRIDLERSMGRNMIGYREVHIDDRKHPFVLKIKKMKNGINLKDDLTYNIQEGASFPKFSLAFHHWIHASHNKTRNFEDFIGKKKVYNVVNGYERIIDNSDNDINSGLIKQLKVDEIFSRYFCNIWEIVSYFDLASDKKKIDILVLSENPNKIIQPIIEFRKLYHKKTDNYTTVLTSGEDLLNNDDKNEINGKLTIKINNTKTNILEYETKDKFNMIVSHTGRNRTENNIQEQLISLDILKTIQLCNNNLENDGTLIMKVYETYTKLSMKYIMILSELFGDVNIIKPLTSRNSETEKYIVCQKFLGNQKFKENLNKKFKSIIKSTNYNKYVMIEDLFINTEIPNILKVDMIGFNSKITNEHYKTINKIMEYINGSNYHGELYAYYQDRQLDMAQYWLENFVSNKIQKENIKRILNDGYKEINDEIENYRKILIGYD